MTPQCRVVQGNYFVTHLSIYEIVHDDIRHDSAAVGGGGYDNCCLLLAASGIRARSHKTLEVVHVVMGSAGNASFLLFLLEIGGLEGNFSDVHRKPLFPRLQDVKRLCPIQNEQVIVWGMIRVLIDFCNLAIHYFTKP